MAVETFDLEKTTRSYLQHLLDSVGYYVAIRVEERNMKALIANLQVSANILGYHLKYGYKDTHWDIIEEPVLMCSLCEQP